MMNMLKIRSIYPRCGRFTNRESNLSNRRYFEPVTTVVRHKISPSGRDYATLRADDQYLHRSIVPTDHFQRSLPRLPIPKLEDTCQRYLNAQQALLSDNEFKKTRGLVDKFRNGTGLDLHNELVTKDKQNKHTSYISEPWSDMYLSSRLPIVLNFNPFISFFADPCKANMDPAIRTTNVLITSLKFQRSLNENVLAPEIFHLNPAKSDTDQFKKVMRFIPKGLSWYGAYLYKAFPLDMSQFKNLFSSTRVPRLGKDEIVSYKDSRHVVVMKRGNFYVFDILDKDGNIAPPSEILAKVQHILNDNCAPAKHPLGYLSAEERNTWASVREKLLNAGNEEALQLIDSGLFCFCFDDENPKDPNHLTKMFLHGNGANRWYDKSFSMLMSPEGTMALNFEHAWGDGVAVLRYINEVFKETTTKPVINSDTKPASIDCSSLVKKLEFKLDDGLKQAISNAKIKFHEAVGHLDVAHVVYENCGRNFLKSERISPDAFMQLSFQMAYYKQFGNFVGSYESCSTSAFKHGRTETIRPCTMETSDACKMFHKTQNRPSVSEMREAIENCSKKHSDLTKEAAMGQGFDRHLFGLRKIAETHGKLPNIFNDPAYAYMNHCIISSSTLSSPAVQLGGFAPVVPNGYGVGYAIQDERLGCNSTGYPPDTSVSEFVECVRQSVKEMHSILLGKDFR
ncbi:carnitine O-palmitoyltransferase 2, mitochondrial-like [Lineus longissimus]|uniref:carnitine O-palmitoyltransferase 2, mitochondrial-like n=1 Tax=Lineus longissimus TaxID=88925 RepID=UPI002B4CEC99